MTDPQKTFEHNRVRILYAPWERGFDQILTPFERFVKHQATAGLLLMFTAMLALLFANTRLGDSYQALLHIAAGITIGPLQMEKDFHYWINDGLMTLFFFVVGLELKREILVGELANIKMAALPVIAALGGMIVPALIYLSINTSGDAVRGWGVPMATDIAFALGVIALLAGRVPKALITFLVALAIVDDLGAIVIIALFYTEQLVWPALITAGAITGLMTIFNLIGIRRPTPYFILGSVLWMALMQSGVHATLAGVVSAFTIPALPRFDSTSFSIRMKELLAEFDESSTSGQSILENQNMVTTVQTMRRGLTGVEAPSQRLEYVLHTPVAFLILPLFAFFNAGIQIDFNNVFASLSQPVVIGVSSGLLIGKFIGITCFSWLALRVNLVSLPASVNMQHICGAALLAGIGFTMSIFTAELAFSHQPDLLLQAKLGILFASILAGTTGYLWLYHLGKSQKN